MSGVAFAAASQSGNFFVVPVKGHQAGKIFLANHDDWGQNVFANTFDEWLEKMLGDPFRLFDAFGGSTRYSDGAGCYQWIPEEIVIEGRPG